MFSDQDRQQIQRQLSQGSVIITANRRLQRALSRTVTPHAWQAAPAIHAAEDWLLQQWDQLQDVAWPGTERTPLSSFQCYRIWHQIIEADPAAPPLISPAQLARKAESAAQLLDEWDLDVTASAFDERQEYRYFRQWYLQFQAYLTKHALADGSYIRRVVQQALQADALPQLSRLLLYGFDDLAPRLQRIFQAAADVVDDWQAESSAPTSCIRTQALDSEGEIRAAALWSRARIEADPSRRVTVVVPQLAAWRPAVERVFAEVYETASWLPEQSRQIPPFNFSAGVPLASTPLVADALLLLKLDQREMEPDQLRRLLLSPFWTGSAGPDGRAMLHYLNASTRMRLTLAEVRRQAHRRAEETGGSLSETLNNLAEAARRQPRQQSYQDWAQYFAGQLKTCGWPGSRTLDSAEYQQFTRFRELLDQLSQCDAALHTPVGAADALQCLTELAEATSFQAQTQASPVQILGLLEAAGLRFDCCWVMDLADTNWPPAAKPNPFLPLDLQVRLGMPRSSAERELHYAQALTERLRTAANEIVFSWPASEGDVELQPSRLIADFPEKPLDALVEQQTPLVVYLNEVSTSAQLEFIECSRGPAWSDLSQALPGGTAALKLQAHCPFNAFAVYRLGAFAREQPSAGLTPAERGMILHELMANLWNKLESQANLLGMSREERDQLVAEQVSATLTRWRPLRDDVLHPRYARLEQQRLEKLAGAWLNLEAERPPFTVVATESRANMELSTARGEVHMRGRIDRVDRLPSGKLLVVDYKTGNASVAQWQGERPADLQLPLYALSQKESVAGISFAELSAKRVAFSGVGQLPAEDGRIDGVVSPDSPRGSDLPSDWGETLTRWREIAGALLEEFLEGRCEAVSYNKSQARFYQHLEPLNRIIDNPPRPGPPAHDRE